MKYPIRKKIPKRTVPTKTYKDYTRYKEQLASDFYDCCGYCGVHHMYFGYQKGFHIDHFAPKSKFPQLSYTYNNLIYSCPVCNCAKHDDWCSDDPLIYNNGQIGYIEPCSADYDLTFFRDNYGKICISNGSTVGKYMYTRMKFFLKRHEIFWLVEYFDDILKKLRIIFDKMDNSDTPYFWEIKDIISKLESMRDKYQTEQRLLKE